MIIKTTDTNMTIELKLRLWRGGWNAGYEPDCSDDIIDGGTLQHDEAGDRIMTESDLRDLIGWWQDEVYNANKGIDGDGLLGLSDGAIANGDEWALLINGNTQENKDLFAEMWNDFASDDVDQYGECVIDEESIGYDVELKCMTAAMTDERGIVYTVTAIDGNIRINY